MKLSGVANLLRQGRERQCKYYVSEEDGWFTLYRKAEGKKKRKRLGRFQHRSVAYTWAAAYNRGAISDPS